jgi:hypothetical protein
VNDVQTLAENFRSNVVPSWSPSVEGLPCPILIGGRYTRRSLKSILTNWQFASGRESRPSLNENHLWIRRKLADARSVVDRR